MASKAITFIKQYFFMLSLVATFVGFSAFKLVPKKQSNQQWFNISLEDEQGSATDENNQIIGTPLNMQPEEDAEEGECRIENEAEPCAVHLNFGTSVTPQMLEDLSVADAKADPSLAVSINKTTSPSGYAKQWLDED